MKTQNYAKSIIQTTAKIQRAETIIQYEAVDDQEEPRILDQTALEAQYNNSLTVDVVDEPLSTSMYEMGRRKMSPKKAQKNGIEMLYRGVSPNKAASSQIFES